MFPGLDLTGIGQLSQCELIRRAQGTDPAMSGRAKMRPLDVALIYGRNDSFDPRSEESPDAGFSGEGLHRVPTDSSPDALHEVPRDRHTQRGMMSEEPHAPIVRQLMVGDDLYAREQESSRR